MFEIWDFLDRRLFWFGVIFNKRLQIIQIKKEYYKNNYKIVVWIFVRKRLSLFQMNMLFEQFKIFGYNGRREYEVVRRKMFVYMFVKQKVFEMDYNCL